MLVSAVYASSKHCMNRPAWLLTDRWARNIAVTAGATEENADRVAEEMVKSGVVRVDKAREILEKIRE